MRLGVLSLLFPLVLGCAGKNTVAGDDPNGGAAGNTATGGKTKSEQLSAAVPSWCESTCKRLQACPAVPCNCGSGGDVCECPTNVSDNCVQGCQESMARFTHDGDACAAVGQGYRACVDGIGCSELNQGIDCEPSSTDADACPSLNSSVDVGSSDPTTSVSYGGASSGPNGGTYTAGTASAGAPGTGGVAGAGTGGTGVGGTTGAPVSCMAGYGTAGMAGGSGTPSSAVTCEEGWSDCTDNHQYSWLCAVGSEGQAACTCFVDGQPTGAFNPGQQTGCPDHPQVNAACGWNLAL